MPKDVLNLKLGKIVIINEIYFKLENKLKREAKKA